MGLCVNCVMGVSSVYLIFYNLLQTLGWSCILYNVAINYVNEEGPEQVWPKVATLLILFQNLAILEVLHCIVGIVRAPVVTTFIQVLSRVAVTYVCMEIPPSREGYIFSLLMISWSVIEIVRYSFYACSLLNVNIYIHKWLRYTLFIVLYPQEFSPRLQRFILPFLTCKLMVYLVFQISLLL